MAINIDVWGTPEEWQGGVYPFSEGDLKTSFSYYDIYNNGSIDLNTIDISPYFWGIGKKSLWCQPWYLSPYIRDNEVQIDKREVLSEYKDLPALFQYTPSQNGASYNMRYAPERTTIPPNSSVYNRNIIMSFNYQKVKIIPYVTYCVAGYTTSSFITSLYDYITTEKYLNYPHIINIGYRVIYGNGENATNPVNGMALLSPYDIAGYDVYYGSNIFYAHSTGIKRFQGAWGMTDANCISACHKERVTVDATIGDPETAFAYNYSISASTNPRIYFIDDDPIWQLFTDYTSDGKHYYYVHYYIDVNAGNIQDVIEYIFKQIAFIGLPFVYDPNNKSKTIGDVGVYLPKFDEYGVTTGEYAEGTNAFNLPNAEWIDGRESGYDPNRAYEGDSGDLNNAGNYTQTFGAEGLTIWAFYRHSLGNNGLSDVIKAITDLYITEPDGNSKWQLDFKGSNPDDYIVSLMAFPLKFQISENSYKFKLGPVTFDTIDVSKYTDTGFFTFGSITVPAYGDFRDFAPYTKAELYIPFCGTCDIDMTFFAGRELIVDMYYDIYTGSCAAAIYRHTSLGKTLYKTINGQIGVEIPLSAARMGDYQSTLHALETAQKQNDIRIATSVLGMGLTAGATIATGGATLPLLAAGVASTTGIASYIQNSDKLNYQLEHTQPKPAQTTAVSTQNNYCVGGTRCMLFVKRAKMLSTYNKDKYAHTVGHACVINTTINEVCTERKNSFIKCSNVDLSGIKATASEISAIQNLLTSGVYV